MKETINENKGNNERGQSNENYVFRLFVLGWMCLGGVNVFLYFLLDFLGFGYDAVENMMAGGTVFLLGLFIYSYVSGKDRLLKALSYTFMLISIPVIVMFFLSMGVGM